MRVDRAPVGGVEAGQHRVVGMQDVHPVAAGPLDARREVGGRAHVGRLGEPLDPAVARLGDELLGTVTRARPVVDHLDLHLRGTGGLREHALERARATARGRRGTSGSSPTSAGAPRPGQRDPIGGITAPRALRARAQAVAHGVGDALERPRRVAPDGLDTPRGSNVARAASTQREPGADHV